MTGDGMNFLAAVFTGRPAAPEPYMDLDRDFATMAAPKAERASSSAAAKPSPLGVFRNSEKREEPPPRYPESPLCEWDPVRGGWDMLEPSGPVVIGPNAGGPRASRFDGRSQKGTVFSGEYPTADDLMGLDRDPSAPSRPFFRKSLSTSSPAASVKRKPLNIQTGHSYAPAVPQDLSPPPPYEPRGDGRPDPMDGIRYDFPSSSHIPNSTETLECLICSVPLPIVRRSSLPGVTVLDDYEDPNGLLCVDCRQNSIRLEKTAANRRYEEAMKPTTSKMCRECFQELDASYFPEVRIASYCSHDPECGVAMLTEDIWRFTDQATYQRYERTIKLKQDQECVVCTETLKGTDFPQTRITGTCTHEPATCLGCIAEHIRVQLDSRTWGQLSCPECPEPMVYVDVRRYATEETFQRYDTLAMRDGIATDPNFRWCPAPGCESGQIHNEGAVAPVLTCIACSARSCFTHQRLWHDGVTCDEFDRGVVAVPDDDDDGDEHVVGSSRGGLLSLLWASAVTDLGKSSIRADRSLAVRLHRAEQDEARRRERAQKLREDQRRMAKQRKQELAGERAVLGLSKRCPGKHPMQLPILLALHQEVDAGPQMLAPGAGEVCLLEECVKDNDDGVLHREGERLACLCPDWLFGLARDRATNASLIDDSAMSGDRVQRCPSAAHTMRLK
ncbi:hypothetical protein GP486_003797 [Trichoglossum hirsutum]|uniref:RING-type domain-containing protein n=1 Tax=Trichoglossum hirsutum TaxID=265104 RepID=A0A9P8LCF5_9PEZI|nr:hypothetical protein GP486_003797 [Trichoglossum hirsutum]